MQVRSILAGVGGYLPARVVINDELARRLETSDAWIRDRTGIRQRHIATAHETCSFMATEAARAALRQAFTSSFVAKIGFALARTALKKMQVRTDPRRYNGAMFLGLNGIAVKSHGGTDALGFANAIGVAIDLARGGFNTRIKEEFGRMNGAGAEDKSVMPGPQAATG